MMKHDYLKSKGLDSEFIERCKNFLFDPGISVLKEAKLASQHFEIHSMHDPTEGGLACGIAEISIASNKGIQIEEANINILPEPERLSKIFNLNPLNTISSGSLLITLEENQVFKLIKLLENNDIDACIIGKIVSKENGLTIKQLDGKIKPLSYSETDDITKIFNS